MAVSLGEFFTKSITAQFKVYNLPNLIIEECRINEKSLRMDDDQWFQFLQKNNNKI